MNSKENVFGVPGIWVPLAVMLLGGAVSFFGEREEKKERIANLEESKNHLPTSPSSMGKAKIKESKPKEKPKPVA